MEKNHLEATVDKTQVFSSLLFSRWPRVDFSHGFHYFRSIACSFVHSFANHSVSLATTPFKPIPKFALQAGRNQDSFRRLFYAPVNKCTQ